MKKTLILAALLTGILGSMFAASETYAEGFEEAIQKLDEAVEERDYKATKELLLEFMPLMKEDIKDSKRSITELKKTDEDELVITEMQAKLDRKKEIFDKFNHLVKSSPAAIRVRVGEIARLIDELEELTT